MNALALAGAALMGGRLRQSHSLGGGSLSSLVRIVLEDGREAIAKTGPSAEVEAGMLRAIRAAGAPAPEVLAAEGKVLVLETLPGGDALGGAWTELGTVLSVLHAARGDRYGWESDYAFGPVAIVNRWSSDWPRFWADHRLLVNLPYVGSGLSRRIERLCADLPNRLPQSPAPSLLHGDLWGGNILVSGRAVSGLIDPACYYGDGEVDIAMLMMFDHPSAAFFSAYGGLLPGHEERLAIYRLWPALVHLRLFGSGYRSLADRLLADLGV
ncbi:MAG TPA: fructosamine kinase family protein [Rhizomicrobium sp.]|nr:fructosamine kinase family protein [Rhizomicrobium sp.]